MTSCLLAYIVLYWNGREFPTPPWNSSWKVYRHLPEKWAPGKCEYSGSKAQHRKSAGLKKALPETACPMVLGTSGPPFLILLTSAKAPCSDTQAEVTYVLLFIHSIHSFMNSKRIYQVPVMYQAPLQNCWDVVVDKARPSLHGVYTPVRKSNDQPGHSEKCHGEESC